MTEQELNTAIDDFVTAQVCAQVDEALKNPTKELKAYIKDNWSKYLGGQFWVSWQAFESFFLEECDLELPDDLNDRARAYRATQSSSGWWYPHTEFVVVSDRPKAIHMEDNELHNPIGLAIEWRDGWGIAAWRGTIIPNEWVTGQPPTAAELLRHPNIEERRAGFELIGWDKLLSELDYKLIDSHPNAEIGDLIEMQLPDADAPDRFIKVLCGTGRTFIIPVPPEMETVLQAQAWVHGYDNPDDFLLPEIRT